MIPAHQYDQYGEHAGELDGHDYILGIAYIRYCRDVLRDGRLGLVECAGDIVDVFIRRVEGLRDELGDRGELLRVRGLVRPYRVQLVVDGGNFLGCREAERVDGGGEEED